VVLCIVDRKYPRRGVVLSHVLLKLLWGCDNGEAYFNRKSNYSLNIQVCTQIQQWRSTHIHNSLSPSPIYISSNMWLDTVEVHMTSLYSRTPALIKQVAIFFDNNEWIWADSAYMLDSWCVTPYKKPYTNVAKNKVFNYHLSQVCQFLIHFKWLPTICTGPSQVGTCDGIHSMFRGP
jgi:hypothetical protein